MREAAHEVAAGRDPVTGLSAGLFGKLPAHGDFVRRGWPDETVDGVDRWLTDAMRIARADRDDLSFAGWMRLAPLWRGYVPPGELGPTALHLAVAPSVDNLGRLFPIAAGVTGEAEKVWAHASHAGDVVDAAVYDAAAALSDADGLVAAIGRTDVREDEAPPAGSAWWLRTGGMPVIESGRVDAALLVRLWREGQD